MVDGHRPLVGAFVMVVFAACSSEPPATCEAAERRRRTMELDQSTMSAEERKASMDSWLPAAVEQCKTEERAAAVLRCQAGARDWEVLRTCPWREPGASADLKHSYEQVLPAALEKMEAATMAGSDVAGQRAALPLLDDAAKAVRGFEPKSQVVRDVLGRIASAIELYRDALREAADATEAGEQGRLDAANARIGEAQNDVVAAETAFHAGMVATGLKRK